MTDTRPLFIPVVLGTVRQGRMSEHVARLNLHAEKVDYSGAGAEGEGLDPDLGGAVEEFHTCPACGRTLSRRAA